MYQFYMSMGEKWRRVLVYERTCMDHLYLIACTVMQVEQMIKNEIPLSYNDASIMAWRLDELFSEANSTIEFKVPLIQYVESQPETASINVVFEKKVEPVLYDLCPRCIECEISDNDERGFLILTLINIELEKWNLNYNKILSERNTKKEIIAMASKLGIQIPKNLKKEECALEFEAAIIKNPELIKEMLSHDEMNALNNLNTFFIGSCDTDSAHTMQDKGFLKYDFNNYAMRSSMAIPRNIGFLLEDYIREAVNDQAHINASLAESYLLGMLNTYGVIEAGRALRMLISFSVKEWQDVPSFILYLKNSFRLCKRMSVIKYKGRTFIYNSLVTDVRKLIVAVDWNRNLDYHLIDRYEAIEASEKEYFYKNDYSGRIIEFLHDRRYPGIYMDMHTLWCTIQNSYEIPHMFEIFECDLQIESSARGVVLLKIFVSHLMDYYNSIPRWHLKGNTI